MILISQQFIFISQHQLSVRKATTRRTVNVSLERRAPQPRVVDAAPAGPPQSTSPSPRDTIVLCDSPTEHHVTPTLHRDFNHSQIHSQIHSATRISISKHRRGSAATFIHSFIHRFGEATATLVQLLIRSSSTWPYPAWGFGRRRRVPSGASGTLYNNLLPLVQQPSIQSTTERWSVSPRCQSWLVGPHRSKEAYLPYAHQPAGAAPVASSPSAPPTPHDSRHRRRQTPDCSVF